MHNGYGSYRETNGKDMNVPEGYELICFLPVGIAEEPLTHASRKAFEERAWFYGYHQQGEWDVSSIDYD
jgi:hypothetical protein